MAIQNPTFRFEISKRELALITTALSLSAKHGDDESLKAECKALEKALWARVQA